MIGLGVQRTPWGRPRFRFRSSTQAHVSAVTAQGPKETDLVAWGERTPKVEKGLHGMECLVSRHVFCKAGCIFNELGALRCEIYPGVQSHCQMNWHPNLHPSEKNTRSTLLSADPETPRGMTSRAGAWACDDNGRWAMGSPERGQIAVTTSKGGYVLTI